jgi:hypothetical protein
MTFPKGSMRKIVVNCFLRVVLALAAIVFVRNANRSRKSKANAQVVSKTVAAAASVLATEGGRLN